MKDRNERIRSRDLEAPPRLVEGLRSAYGARVDVPRAVDDAVLGAARTQLARGRRLAVALRLTMVGAIATAVVLVVAFVVTGPALSPDLGRAPSPPEAVLAREDVDGNGHVDILDAFALARRVESSGEIDRSWDMNRDGLVDSEDVDHIALAAVRLQ